MRYLLMIYGDEPRYEAATEDEQREMSLPATSTKAPRRRRPHAQAGRSSRLDLERDHGAGPQGGEQLVTDGPFAETKEQLGGYFIVDVADLDTAIATRRRLPSVHAGAHRGPPARRHVMTTSPRSSTARSAWTTRVAPWRR